MKIVYFHRNLKSGFSINKVSQTVIRRIPDKEEYFMPCWGASAKNIIRNIFYVWKHRDYKCINHITGDIYYCALALIGCKSVITYHDVVALKFNKYSPFKRKIIEWLWYRVPLKIATKVVCISDETRKELQKYTNRSDILVVHNAIDDIFKESLPSLVNEDIKKILLIGTKKNKNLLRTFAALEGLRCKVVIIGNLDEEQVVSLERHHIDYDNKTGLSDSEIVDEYIKCDIVSFISLYEGFGMIVVEANKVGRPVICSNIPVLKEVANDSALLVNPYDVEEIREGYIQLLNNSELRNDLINKGLLNAKRFDSAQITSEWVKIYNSL